MRQQTGKVTAQLKLKTLNDNPYANGIHRFWISSCINWSPWNRW